MQQRCAVGYSKIQPPTIVVMLGFRDLVTKIKAVISIVENGSGGDNGGSDEASHDDDCDSGGDDGGISGDEGCGDADRFRANGPDFTRDISSAALVTRPDDLDVGHASDGDEESCDEDCDSDRDYYADQLHNCCGDPGEDGSNRLSGAVILKCNAIGRIKASNRPVSATTRRNPEDNEQQREDLVATGDRVAQFPHPRRPRRCT